MIRDLGIVLLRVFAGLSMAFAHGIGKLPPSERFLEGVTELGFPLPAFFAWSAGMAEFGGGVLVALGLLTRPAALVVSFTMFVAAFMQHASDPYQMKELALVYFFVFLAFVGTGGGRFSLDHILLHQKKTRSTKKN